MKARPYKIVDEVYVQCEPSEATHLGLRLPGPLEYRILPVKVKTNEEVKAEKEEKERKAKERERKAEERRKADLASGKKIWDRVWDDGWGGLWDDDWWDNWQGWKPDENWTWNGDIESPSLSPSIVTAVGKHRCHSWITDGKVKFFVDSTHEFAGQTLDLLELDP